MKSRSHILRLLVVVVFGCFAISAVAADSRPNLVFILADDLGWADVAFHGGSAPTPNLDRLVADNVELTQHYVAPVCSPTRVGLLTGHYWSRFNVTQPINTRALPTDTVTLASALQSAGYDTCLTGKWHLGSKPEWGPNHYGFDHSYGSLAGGVAPWNHLYKRGPYSVTWHRNETFSDDEGHVTDVIATEAVRWLKDRGDQPFFLYVPFTAVHLPVEEPSKWLGRVPVEITGNVPRHYAACIMHLDDAVGRIIEAMEETGKRENTLLVFTSDNGGSPAGNNEQNYPERNYPEGTIPANNAPLRGHKGQLYEGGIRVPTIVSWPGRIEVGRCNVPLMITDWMPTFCALANYVPSNDLNWDGEDVWPVITQQSSGPSRTLYWTGPGYRSRAIRDGDWKLIIRGNGGTTSAELFNLSNDPNETTNLTEQMPDRVSQLRRRLQNIAASDGDAAESD